MNLSERLEAACTGVLVAEATGNLDIVTDAVNKLLDAAREAAELARRVEEAPIADILEDGANGGASALLSAATRAGYYQGLRVRLVPEDGQEAG